MHGGDGNQATSVTKIFGNIFISFVGAGVLGLPYAFKESGVLEGILVMLFVAYLAVKAMLLLIDCKYRCLDMKNHDNYSMKQSLLGNQSGGNQSNSDGESLNESRIAKNTKKAKKRREDDEFETSAQISYGSVGKMAFGKWGALTVDAAIVISQIGFCCAYIIFLSQNISHYLAGCYEDDGTSLENQDTPDVTVDDLLKRTEELEKLTTLESPTDPENRDSSFQSTVDIADLQSSLTAAQQKEIMENCEVVAKSYQSTIVVVCVLPLLLLCQVRHLNRLAIFSLLADFANVFAYLIVFWFDFEHVSKVTIHPKEMDFMGLPFFLSVSMYCYEGAGMILALEESVHPDFRSKFKQIFSGAMMAITMLYIVFGVSGYLSFGPDTRAIITLNLPAGIFPGIVKACLCFSLFFTFPMGVGRAEVLQVKN